MGFLRLFFVERHTLFSLPMQSRRFIQGEC